jgi:hypothetical protein
MSCRNISNSILIAFLVLMCSCQAESPVEKINGISLVAARDSLLTPQLQPLIKTRANYVALMPYAFTSEKDPSELIFNLDRQWFGERVEGVQHSINILKKENLRIMLKPHIWIRGGEFTGDLEFSTEKDWKNFETAYRDYILLYAELAEKNHLNLLCIGTELFSFVNERPIFWKELIQDVRKVYKGKLVYAENWDKVDKVTIWSDLDYIGVDAYFPLSDKISPGKEDISLGWKEHLQMLEDLSTKLEKSVLFTEYGYRNMDYALIEPWNSKRELNPINHQLQAKALEVLYEEVWNQSWFAGGFLWKWHQNTNSGGLDDDQFTPQNKPAEKVIRKYYGKFRN